MEMHLTPAAASGPGLHLTFADGETLSLTTDSIEARACALLADPAKIPPSVQQAAAFHPCRIRPQRDMGAGGPRCNRKEFG